MLDSPPSAPIVSDLSAAILSSSVVTRLGLACPDSRARERAAEALAMSILEWEGYFEPDEDQLPLPL